MENKINDLEAKISFQEDAFSKLSDAFGNQQIQLGNLEREFDVLKQHLIEVLQSQSTQEATFQQSEKPPHY